MNNSVLSKIFGHTMLCLEANTDSSYLNYITEDVACKKRGAFSVDLQ